MNHLNSVILANLVILVSLANVEILRKKSVKSGAYRKNGQFDNSIKSGAYENFGVLSKFVILVNEMIFKKSY